MTRLSLPNFRVHRVCTGNHSLKLWRRWAAGERTLVDTRVSWNQRTMWRSGTEQTICEVSGRNFLLFKFRLLTKSRFPRSLIIAWKSRHSRYPLVFLPPFTTYTSRRTRTRTEQKLDSIVISQSCPKTTTTTSVTDISTLGISNRGDLWRLPPHLPEPSQAGASSGRNPPDDKLTA